MNSSPYYYDLLVYKQIVLNLNHSSQDYCIFPMYILSMFFKTFIGFLSCSIHTLCIIHTIFGTTQFEQRIPKFMSEFSIYVTNISLTNNSTTSKVVTIVIVSVYLATLVNLSTTAKM